MNKLGQLFGIGMMAALLHCSTLPMQSSSGSSSETVIGKIVDESGEPKGAIVVSLFPGDYSPVTDKPLPATSSSITNKNGEYAITVDASDTVTYNIQAVNPADGTSALITGIAISLHTGTTAAPEGIIRKPGSVKIILPPGIDAASGYVYVPGTAIFAMLNGAVDFIILDSVPAGTVPSVSYASKSSVLPPIVLADTVQVVTGGTTIVAFDNWAHSRMIGLNTTASGADVAGIVFNFPVLIRLTSDNFNFGEAKSGGEDIRFAKADGTPLAYEIESWDSANATAVVWVKVDTIYGNSDKQQMVMYWGASKGYALYSLSSGVRVFDTSSGFAGVWHLAGLPGDTARDASGNRFNGVASGMSGTVPVPGAIGACRAFDGVTSAIEIPGTSSGKLNFPENSIYTLSAWVYLDTLIDSVTHMIVGKGAQQYFMKCYAGMEWEFTEFHTQNGWNRTTYGLATAKEWVFLTGVRNGAKQELYLNGMLVSSGINVPKADLLPRDTTQNIIIGRYLQFHDFHKQGFAFFDGKIDEVRIGNREMSADWIKLCYMNQKMGDKLVVFK